MGRLVQVEGVLHVVPGGKSGNPSADLVAGVFLIGLPVMAFLERGEKDEMWGHYIALG